jgi:hypothetical protein
MSTSLRRLSFLFLVFMVACVPVLGQSQGSGTRTPIDEAVMQTVTMRAIEQADTGHEVATVYAEATALSQDSTAQALIDNAAFQATATAIVPVLEELPRYGVNPLEGHVAWLHKPVTLDLNGYMQSGYANDYPEVTAADFVLVADITWNTLAGTAGCGFMFRSDGNKEKPSQFMVDIARFANGTLYFSALVGGNLANAQIFYPKSKDNSFNWLNDSTNRLAVVARGKMLEFYTNGVKIGEVDITKPPPATINAPVFPQSPVNPSPEQLREYQDQVSQFSQIINQNQADLLEAQQNYYNKKIATFMDGFLGFMSASEYGHTVCKFSNAWLFSMKTIPTLTPSLTPTRTITRTPTVTATPTRRFDTPMPSTTSTPKEKPYGSGFFWNDRFNNSEQNRTSVFEQKGFPVSILLTGTGFAFWIGTKIRSSISSSRRRRTFTRKLLSGIIQLIAGLW